MVTVDENPRFKLGTTRKKDAPMDLYDLVMLVFGIYFDEEDLAWIRRARWLLYS